MFFLWSSLIMFRMLKFNSADLSCNANAKPMTRESRAKLGPVFRWWAGLTQLPSKAGCSELRERTRNGVPTVSKLKTKELYSSELVETWKSRSESQEWDWREMGIR